MALDDGNLEVRRSDRDVVLKEVYSGSRTPRRWP